MNELELPPPNHRVRDSGKPIAARKWLNDDTGATAFVGVRDGEMKIADCNRVVTLSFNMWGETDKDVTREFTQACKKLQRIVSACASMRDNLAIEYKKQLKRSADEAIRKEKKIEPGRPLW